MIHVQVRQELPVPVRTDSVIIIILRLVKTLLDSLYAQLSRIIDYFRTQKLQQFYEFDHIISYMELKPQIVVY